MNLVEIVKGFPEKNIAVIGDFCLDEHRICDPSKFSNEAPIPVYTENELKYNPGAAGHTTCNVASLNGNAYPIAVIGYTNYDNKFLEELERFGEKINTDYIIRNKDRRIHRYTKVYGRRTHSPDQQLLRIDTAPLPRITKGLEDEIVERIKSLLDKVKVDALIISDYSKGYITPKILEELIYLCERYSILSVGDSRNNIGNFCGIDYVVPNDNEAISAVYGSEDESKLKDVKIIHTVGKNLLNKLKCKGVIITRGRYGMSVFEKDKKAVDISTKAKEVFDVTGAGDTVTATVTLALASGASLEEAARIANYAGGVVVGKPGTATISQTELINAIENDKH